MDNLALYNEGFKSLFNVSDAELEDLEYQSVELWDSVGHMGLMSYLEENFDIMFEPQDILDFSSYKKGKEILKKYDVEIN